jgi:hypothetical protein
MPPDIALDASRLYMAATSYARRGEPYQAALANLVNRLREYFGQDIIPAFEDFLDQPSTETQESD